MSQTNERNMVGLEPWLPWPLKTWGSWTRPVRAERLAVLRIAMAGCLLIDILTSYRVGLHDFFGQGGLGGSHMFAYYSEAPKLNWSLLRGFGDPLLGTLALGMWVILTAWIALDFWHSLSVRDEPAISRRNGWSVLWWLASGVFVVLGVWSRSIKDGEQNRWTIPLGMAAFAVLFALLELWKLTRRQQRKLLLGMFIASAFALSGMAGLSLILPCQAWSEEETFSLGHRLLLSWQDDPLLLNVAFWTWAAATILLLAGWWTRAAAILTWALSMSFANANPNIDNAGDIIRGITLFYLMLCPCGAAWSVDRLLQGRRPGNSAPAYVWPWPLRLLLVQLTLIYFMNGLYKITSATWLEGDSLYYVLCDLTLTRFSITRLAIPFIVTRVSTWLVLGWELSFPVLVVFRRTRWLALLFGMVFHLGIFATMELGGFVPYILCLYLPLLPWDKWLGE